MNTRQVLLGLGAASLLGLSAGAQTPRIAAIQQQPIPGVGNVTWIDEIELTEDGRPMIEVDTNVSLGSLVLLSDAIALREGDPVAPAPAAIARFQSLSMARNGEFASINILGGTPSYLDDGGVYAGGTGLLLQEGDAVSGGTWTPGTVYLFFSDVIVNANRQALVRGYVDDPLVGDNLDYFASIVTYDATGTLVGQTFVIQEFDLLPGASAPIDSIGLTPDGAGFNTAGHVLFTAYLDTGMQTVGDSTVWLWDGVGYTMLAREGDPSPVPGRLWGSLLDPALSLNDAGDWVMISRLDSSDSATDEILVKNGATLAQEGDALPALGGHRLRGFGSGGARLDDAGNVLWWGRWDDPDPTRNHGIFLNDQLLIQTGRVRVDGMLLAEIDDRPGALALSADGRWVMFRGTFLNGRRAALVIDLEDPIKRFCFGQDYASPCPCGNSAPEAGCDNSFGTGGARLLVEGEPSLANDTLSFYVDGLPPDALVVLLDDFAPPLSESGAPFGDGTLCSGGGYSFLAARYATGGAVGFGSGGDPAISTLGSVVQGEVRYYQAIYRNQRPFCTPQGFNLSSGLRIIWQP